MNDNLGLAMRSAAMSRTIGDPECPGRDHYVHETARRLACVGLNNVLDGQSMLTLIPFRRRTVLLGPLMLRISLARQGILSRTVFAW